MGAQRCPASSPASVNRMQRRVMGEILIVSLSQVADYICIGHLWFVEDVKELPKATS